MATFTGPIYISVSASTKLRCLVSGLGILLFAIVIACYPLSWVMGVWLVATLLYLRRLTRFCTEPSVTGILLDSSNQWTLFLRTKERVSAELFSFNLLGSRFAALNFRSQYGVKNVFLMSDNVESDAFRRLRVRLRHPYQP
ncbi:MAG: protein YgfX [Pseudomonadota bacterium]